MKSPAELAAKLGRQWQSAALRTSRLLQRGHWPLRLAIGRPAAGVFARETEAVRRHVQSWRQVRVGKVAWESTAYRAGEAPVELPVAWEIGTPSEWIEATGDAAIQAEYRALGQLVEGVDTRFHALILRHRGLVLDRPAGEVFKASEVALALSPGCAGGRPLRAVTVCNIDSKFMERNRALLTQMLDTRFGGLASGAGLEAFLGAAEDSDHWLLVAPLEPGLLPFAQQRVPVGELAGMPAAASHILIVENERCLHQLPALAGTVAILGAGLHLGWMRREWLAGRRVAYWGDLDTWGLAMLAGARRAQPGIQPILMDRACFDRHAPDFAVNEPVRAGDEPPEGLDAEEAAFYRYLLGRERGRLEQEFLPADTVAAALRAWHGQAPP